MQGINLVVSFEITFYVTFTTVKIWSLGTLQGHFDDVEKPSILSAKVPKEHKELVW